MGSNNYSVPLEQGAPFVLRPADPIAGASLPILVPNHLRWEFHYIRFLLANDGNAAVRRVTFRVDDPAGNFITWDTDITLAASLTFLYILVPGASNAITTIDGNRFGFFPENILLLPNMTLTILIQNIQAGDQISGILLYGRQWAERSV